VSSHVKELNWETDNTTNENAAFLENIFLACIKDTIGVAENGAVWITGRRYGQPAATFYMPAFDFDIAPKHVGAKHA